MSMFTILFPNLEMPTCLLCVCLSGSVYCEEVDIDAVPPLPKESAYLYARFNKIKKLTAKDFADIRKFKIEKHKFLFFTCYIKSALLKHSSILHTLHKNQSFSLTRRMFFPYRLLWSFFTVGFAIPSNIGIILRPILQNTHYLRWYVMSAWPRRFSN